MKRHQIACSLLLLLSTGRAATAQPLPKSDKRNERKEVQLKLQNGSTATGSVIYVTPDGRIVELQTATRNRPIRYTEIQAVRRNDATKQWKKRPPAWIFQQRYDLTWEDPCRWEFGFYGDYGIGVGRHAVDRYEAGINLRYRIKRYLFAGLGTGINSMRGIDRVEDRENWIPKDRQNTTGFAVFADVRGYFRDRAILRPFVDLRIGYNFATGTYPDSQSRQLTDQGWTGRFGAGITLVDCSDCAYSLSVGYHANSVKLTELTKETYRRISGSIAIHLAIDFRW